MTASGGAVHGGPAPVPPAPTTPPAARRTYDASGRRAEAERRRAGIAEAAARLFAEHGWTGTTIAGVAREAGVSAELVSKAFGGKQGLFMAAFRSASFGSGGPLPHAFAAMRLDEEPDVEVRLGRVVDFACRALVPMAPLVAVMASGTDQDPVLRDLVAQAQLGHAGTAAELTRLIAPGPVGPDAVDEVYLLTRAETFLTLVHQRGWSLERYAGWLRRSLRGAVDGDGRPGGGRPIESGP